MRIFHRNGIPFSPTFDSSFVPSCCVTTDRRQFILFYLFYFFLFFVCFVLFLFAYLRFWFALPVT